LPALLVIAEYTYRHATAQLPMPPGLSPVFIEFVADSSLIDPVTGISGFLLTAAQVALSALSGV
jgi:hypothetical protein